MIKELVDLIKKMREERELLVQIQQNGTDPFIESRIRAMDLKIQLLNHMHDDCET